MVLAALLVVTAAGSAMGGRCEPRLLSLLIQRAVQSCCYTSRQCRDPPTADWLEGFGGHVGLETFHGIDGLRVPADEYIRMLLRAPAEQITVHSVIKKHRGLSASNPYLQPSTMTYEVTVRPLELADRVMRMAANIAAEWLEDLPRIGECSWWTDTRVTARDGLGCGVGVFLGRFLQEAAQEL
eukprot:scaffold312115_cov27-Tisochrysis_lutea.AAC.1